MSIKKTIIATLCLVQIVVCIVGCLSFYGVIGSVPSNVKVYYYDPINQKLLHDNLDWHALSVEINPIGSKDFDIKLNDDYGIYLDVDSLYQRVSFSCFYQRRNGSYRMRYFNRPEFPFPIYHQLRVTRLVENIVFKGVGYRSESTRFEDTLSVIYYLIVMSWGLQLLLVPLSIIYLYKSQKKE